MNPSLARLLFMVGIAGLFYLDRDRSVRVSKSLWLPVIWLWIIGSRPVSVWFGMTPAVTAAVEGSPFDAVIFGVLLVAGIVVLVNRSKRASVSLRASWPVLLYFAYCLISVVWSDFPDIALKRWIKAIGDLAMVLVVVTDPEPVAAVERLISRVGFILMPASILLIKYFNDLGRAYDPDGDQMNTGVTTNKNMLGVITLVISLGAVWRFVNLLLSKREPNRTRKLLAWGVLLAFCIAVLAMADSATVACFTLGTALLLATYLPFISRRPGRVHALVAMILLGGGITMLFGGQSSVVHALGRKTNLTGRTDIWRAVLPVVPNPVVGAGFESFWMGPRLQKVYSNLSGYMHVNEAHDGYIEVYLNLGAVGVGLIAINLISGYRGSVAAFRRYPRFGALMLAYVAAAAIYSFTEAGFRMLDPIWMFLLLAIVASHTVASGRSIGTGTNLGGRARPVTKPFVDYELASAR
jgi:exopolysaccharide production protein ExoQ